jgi:TPP-dependent pyruvate/acetoin dehydrogenase alpha subunit
MNGNPIHTEPSRRPAESAPNAPDAREFAREILRLRLSQMLVNERYRAGEFRIPIHLAMGHEAIAVAMSAAMTSADGLVLPHRNLHYNLARGATLRSVLDEFLLKEEGLAQGTLGSMNLSHRDGGVVYTSSILANCLGVGVGVALGDRMRNTGGLTIIVTGDGAMEEGSFHECLMMLRSQDLPAFLVVENNEWSMATRIEERRRPVDLEILARAYGATYARLEGNDVVAYAERLGSLRADALSKATPCVIEVQLSTLGDWRLFNDDHPEGKYINYHAGPAPEVKISAWPLLRESDADPLHALTRHIGTPELKSLARTVLEELEREAA